MERTTRTQLRLRRQRRTRTQRRSVLAMAMAFMMVFTGVAVADYITAEITLVDGQRTKTLDLAVASDVSVPFKLTQERDDADYSGNCNVGADRPATFAFASDPPGVTASNITFTTCTGAASTQSSSFSAPVGTYDITLSQDGTNVGGIDTAAAAFRLVVTDSSAPANTAPSVDFTGGPTTVEESSIAEHTYTFSITDPDVGDSWTFADGYPTCGTAGGLVQDSQDIDAATGSFKCTFDDGPASSTVAVKVVDAAGAASDPAARSVTVTNVAPTATLSRGGPANVFAGTTVTYNASATDPSAADTNEGFTWSFNEGGWTSPPTATAQLQQTYTTCGLKTESVEAQDKDGGTSAPAIAGVSVHDGGFHGAIKPAVRNMVQKGRVVPVQILVSCDGVHLADLNPTIQLLKGEFDPATEPDSDAVLVATSVSAADSSGVMRWTGESYMYNLQVPKDGVAGQHYTIRVRPWGADGAVLQSVIEIRR